MKVGVIGLGVGESHIAGYKKHPNCDVVALCDFSETKLDYIKKKYPKIKLTLNADDILEDKDIDVVSIASYDNYHYKQIIKAINYDKHIFVEKPICLYEKELEDIFKLLNKKKYLKISSNLILRMSPRFRELKSDIAKDKYGILNYIEGDYNYGRVYKITEGWRGDIDYYSVVFGGGIHIIDLMLWLTNDKVVEVSSFGNNIATKGTKYKYNDIIVSILKFKSGIIGKVTSNYSCVYPHFHKLSVYGTKATFENGINHALLYSSRDPKHHPKKILSKYPGVKKGDLIYSFIESILGNGEAEVSKEDVINTMSICLTIEKSMNKMKTLKVNYL